MTARVEVLMTVKDAQAYQAWQRSKNSIGAFMDELGKLPALNQRVETSGKKVFESVRTPLERFKAEIKNLSELYQKGEIDQETYSRAIKRQNDLLAKAEQAMVKVDAAQEAMKASGEQIFQQTRTPAEQYAATMKRLNDLLEKGAIDTDVFSRAQLQAKATLDATDESLKKVTADNQRLEQAAKRVFETTRTPLEKYNAEMDHLNELLKKGKIDQDAYNRAAAQAVNTLKSTDEGLKKVAADNEQLKQSGKQVWESTRTPLEKYNSEVARLDNLLKKQMISEETHRRAVVAKKQAYEQAEQAGKSFFGGVASGTMQALTAFTGIGSVIGGIAAICAVVRAEYDNLLQRQKTAADRQIDTAAAQESAIANLGEDPSMDVNRLNERVIATSKKTGVLPVNLYKGASNVLSARGDISADTAYEALDLSAQMFKKDPAGMVDFAGAMLDIKKANPNLEYKQIAGQMLATKSASRITENSAFAKNAVPSIKQLMDFGNDLQQASGLYASLTQNMVDQEGSRSGTAAIQMAKQLEELLPTKKFPQLKNTIDRIKYVQDHPQLQKKFFDKQSKNGEMSLEAKAYTAIKGTLSSEETSQKRVMAGAMQTIPRGENAAPFADKYMEKVKSQGIQQTTDVSMLIGAAAERASISDLAGGMSGAAREGLKKVLQASGISKMEQDWAATKFDAATQLGNTNPVNYVASEFESRGKELTTRVPDQFVGGGEGPAVQIPGRERTPDEMQKGNGFLELADLLRRQVELQEKQLKAQEEANKKKDQPTEVNVTVDGQKAKPRTATANLPAKPRPAEVLNAQGGR